MNTQHATLSASAAHRWINCTPSALLEAEKPENNSAAAEEGTAAHALAEHKLRKKLGQPSTFPRSEWINDEMREHTENYVRFVWKRYKQALKTDPAAELLLEQRLDFSHIVPEGFGTGDAVIIADGTLTVIDLKYGQGVLVEADSNPQLRLYTAGAYETFNPVYDIDELEMVIYQPRRDNISAETIAVEELDTWLDEVVKPAAILAAAGEGEFKAGSWCQFCKLSATCRARAEQNMRLAQQEFKPAAELSREEIAEILAQLPELKAWAAAIEKHALADAVDHGATYPGFKLVEGRSIRKYVDDQQVAAALEQAGHTDVWERKLLGITAMQKLLGKKEFDHLLGDLLVKPAGKPTLVPESDKRAAITAHTAEADFSQP